MDDHLLARREQRVLEPGGPERQEALGLALQLQIEPQVALVAGELRLDERRLDGAHAGEIQFAVGSDERPDPDDHEPDGEKERRVPQPPPARRRTARRRRLAGAAVRRRRRFARRRRTEQDLPGEQPDQHPEDGAGDDAEVPRRREEVPVPEPDRDGPDQRHDDRRPKPQRAPLDGGAVAAPSGRFGAFGEGRRQRPPEPDHGERGERGQKEREHRSSPDPHEARGGDDGDDTERTRTRPRRGDGPGAGAPSLKRTPIACVEPT
jgi:hypothetical protein